MTTGTVASNSTAGSDAPASWRELRQDSDIQFEPVVIPEQPPREPGWLEEFFKWLGEVFSPVGGFLAQSWPVLKWILLAILVAAVLYTIYRMLGPQIAGRNVSAPDDEAYEWKPDQQAALALLEDADRLAAEGRFDEATHLLLQRSVGQIAAARPDWVVPSSTARELANISALPAAARSAFGTIAERVERSLFALRSLDRTDWDAARAAYAEFALARIEGARR